MTIVQNRFISILPNFEIRFSFDFTWPVQYAAYCMPNNAKTLILDLDPSYSKPSVESTDGLK